MRVLEDPVADAITAPRDNLRQFEGSQGPYRKRQRDQSVLLPKSSEEHISAENPVPVIDVFVDTLDLKTKGFTIEFCLIRSSTPA